MECYHGEAREYQYNVVKGAERSGYREPPELLLGSLILVGPYDATAQIGVR